MMPITLLIIDDYPDFTKIVKLILEHDTNWRVLTASNGKEGLAIAQLQQPNMILLDIVMPNLNGIDVYHQLKANPRTCSIPIIFITAMAKTEQAIKSQIEEDIELITKPFTMVTLKERVMACDRNLVKNT